MTNANYQKIDHPIFNSYKNQENLLSKENRITNFLEELSEMSSAERLAFLKGEGLDIITDLNDYSGNISTSQLKNIDYSKFSNHVFFDSAVHKVKYAFDEIIQFPYDAKEVKYYEYITNLDGYTKHVLENIYPKYIGHIEFKNEVKVVIKDRKGFLLNDDTSNKIVEGILSPTSNNGFTFSFHVSSPSLNEISNHNNQTIFKKVIIDQSSSVSEGYFCYFEKIQNDSESCFLVMCIIKDQKLFLKKCKISLSSKDYINIVIYKNNENNFEIDFYVNSEKSDSISEGQKISYELFTEEFGKKDIEFVIGDGENNTFLHESVSVTLNSFSGKIDEFVFFNKKREESDIRLYRDQNIFADADVLLYLKFNEAGGSHINCDLVVDASGNKLHGVLLNVSDDSRITDTSNYKVSDVTNPTFLKNEELEKNPIVLGSVNLIKEKRNEYIEKGKKYDSENSNLIFNLMPTHYFSESSNYEETSDYTNSQITESDTLSSSSKSSNSHLTQICLIWARFFDQLKLYVDAISDIFNLSYEDINEQNFVNSQMEILCKLYGFDFTEIDLNRTQEKSEKKNITFLDVKDEIGIVKLQNMIWKKILLSSQDIIRSKGTRNSINSFINTLGFDIKKYAYIEEKAYQNYINLDNSFETTDLEICELNFTKFKNNNITYDSNNRIKNHPHALIPNIRSVNSQGDVISGFEENCTFEIFFNLNKIKEEYNNKQTLLQLVSNVNSGNFCWGILRLEFKSSKSSFCDIVLDISPFVTENLDEALNNIKQVKLENINLFDVSHYVSINFKKDTSLQNLVISLNYSTIGDVTDLNRIASNKTEYTISQNEFLYLNNAFDLSFGHNNYTNEQPQIFDSSLLNSNGFEGSLYNVKIWKKSLSDLEMLKHSKDILSISEESLNIKKSNLISNFYFNDILNTTIDNDNTFAVYSPDSYFPYIDKNTAGNEINFCIITLNFDEGIVVRDPVFLNRILRKTNSASIDKIDSNNLNRVRILSFKDEENKKAYNNYESYPISDYPIDYESLDTDFITISISSSKNINDAFERLITKIENITDLITSNQKIYEYSYIDIDRLRHDFFENYDDKAYFDYDNLNNIFKYFDNIMNSVLLTLIPSDVTFKGFNLVYESHILERAKYQYKNKESNVSIQASDELFMQTRFDPCKAINKRSTSYNNNRKLAE